MSAAASVQEQNARRFLGIAATLGVVGVAFNLNGDGTLPKLLVGAGMLALIWSIHRFGRLGPDAPIVFAEPQASDTATKKKKRKKKRAPAADVEPNDAG